MWLLCGPDRLELVFVHLAPRIALANTLFFRVERGEVFAKCATAGFFDVVLELGYSTLDRAGILVFFWLCLAVAEESASLRKVVYRAAQFEEGEFLVKRLRAQEVRNHLCLSPVFLAFACIFFGQLLIEFLQGLVAQL